MAGQRDELRLVLELLGSIGDHPVDDLGGLAVLDCGGGTGRIAVALAEHGAQVTVVDISVDALATLSRRSIDAGVADRVGSLAPGKDADILILSGDPLELTTHIERVLVNGQVVYRAE